MEQQQIMLWLVCDTLGLLETMPCSAMKKLARAAVYLLQGAGIEMGYIYTFDAEGLSCPELDADYTHVEESTGVADIWMFDEATLGRIEQFRRFVRTFLADHGLGLTSTYLTTLASVAFLRPLSLDRRSMGRLRKKLLEVNIRMSKYDVERAIHVLEAYRVSRNSRTVGQELELPKPNPAFPMNCPECKTPLVCELRGGEDQGAEHGHVHYFGPGYVVCCPIPHCSEPDVTGRSRLEEDAWVCALVPFLSQYVVTLLLVL
jgi:hypothetical protein